MANVFLDIGSSAVGGSSLLPASVTTTVTGGAVDLVQSNGVMSVASLLVGAVVGDTPAIDVKIQQSNSSASGFADIPGATFSQVTTSGVAGTSGFQMIAFQRSKRYTRAYVGAAGITSAVVGVGLFGPAATQPPGTGGWDTNPSGQAAAPTLTSGTVSANGTTVTLVFSEPVIWTGDGGTPTVVTALGGGNLTYVSGSGTATLVFSVPSVIAINELAPLVLQTNDVRAMTSGNGNAVIANRLLTNSSTQAAATLTSATILANGTSLSVVYSAAVSGFTSGAEGHALTLLSGGATTLAYASGEGTATIVFTISRTVASAETGGKLAYTAGDIVTVSNALPVVSYTAQSVTNNSAQP